MTAEKILTFEQLVLYARDVLSLPLAQVPIGRGHELAQGIIDLLGESQPCGMEPPPIVSFGNGEVGVLVDDRADTLTVSETRAYCAMVLRTADEAQERNR